jgi:hypothetical protein
VSGDEPAFPEILTVDDEERIAEASQERIHEVYREYGFDGEPNITPGLVGIVFQEIKSMLEERGGE